MLRYIVPCAESENANHHLFVANRSRHDHRQVYVVDRHRFEDVDRIHVGKAVIEQEHIVVIDLQPRQAGLSVIDYVELNIGSGSREMMACQVGIGSVIFGIEQSHLSIHALRLRRARAATRVVGDANCPRSLTSLHCCGPQSRSYITCMTTFSNGSRPSHCLLYTSDAADE